MDKSTYEQKLTAYKCSNASIELKQKAIEKLDMQYYGTPQCKMQGILASITQSQAELKSEEYSA